MSKYKATLLAEKLVIAALATSVLLVSPMPAVAAGPATVTYSYDSLGRLVENVQPVGNSGSYTYDSAGNRTASTQN